MYLTGLTHRDELFGITLRWLNDELHEDDGRRLTEIFLYESVVTAPCVLDRMLRFFQRFTGAGLSLEGVRYKHVLRERLIQCSRDGTERTAQLARAYLSNPEFFFPRMPVDAVLLFAPGQRLVSINRIKRMPRVAEKAGFRMADALAERIRSEAKRLAGRRASARGLSLEHMVSTQPEMTQDFFLAEQAVAAGFRNHKIELAPTDATINDIIGFKIIGDEAELERAERELGEEPGVTIIERKKHEGRYNAVNLRVDIELPPVGQIVDDNRNMDWSVARHRGLDPEEARRGFAPFVEAGARSVRTEVIFTTYPELLESELGRSLHESRIIQLRERQSYSGPIADNARYLIEYLLAVAYAPTVHVPELPIKMWGRYLPETLLAAVRNLYGLEPTGILLRTLGISSGFTRPSD